MSEQSSPPEPDPYDDSPEQDPYEDAWDRAKKEPPRELTSAEQDLVFRAQLILFLIMGVFIIVPFIVWWWLSMHKN